MLLEIKNLSKHYGGVTAIRDINLSVAEGTVAAIIGGNGAGKSTLVKCITGAETPDTGEIYLGSKKLRLGSPEVSREAGIEMVYQDLKLCPQLTVFENIYLGQEKTLKFFGMPTPFLDKRTMRQNAKKILEKINASVPMDAEAGKLSGGQRQAVAIARALLNTPKLLILDEPTAALGVLEAKKLVELIKSLKAGGITVMIISHDMVQITAVADQVVELRQGTVTKSL